MPFTGRRSPARRRRAAPPARRAASAARARFFRGSSVPTARTYAPSAAAPSAEIESRGGTPITSMRSGSMPTSATTSDLVNSEMAIRRRAAHGTRGAIGGCTSVPAVEQIRMPRDADVEDRHHERDVRRERAAERRAMEYVAASCGPRERERIPGRIARDGSSAAAAAPGELAQLDRPRSASRNPSRYRAEPARVSPASDLRRRARPSRRRLPVAGEDLHPSRAR